ncbi:unnamed protein product, partial [Thlaspi arvense]
RHYEVVYLIHEDHAKEVESVNLKVQGQGRNRGMPSASGVPHTACWYGYEDYDEYEVEDVYEDEAGEEVWDDQYEGDMIGNGIDMEDAMDVENYVDEYRESRNSNKPSNVGKTGRMKLRPKKVGR